MKLLPGAVRPGAAHTRGHSAALCARLLIQPLHKGGQFFLCQLIIRVEVIIVHQIRDGGNDAHKLAPAGKFKLHRRLAHFAV